MHTPIRGFLFQSTASNWGPPDKADRLLSVWEKHRIVMKAAGNQNDGRWGESECLEAWIAPSVWCCAASVQNHSKKTLHYVSFRNLFKFHPCLPSPPLFFLPIWNLFSNAHCLKPWYRTTQTSMWCQHASMRCSMSYQPQLLVTLPFTQNFTDMEQDTSWAG